MPSINSNGAVIYAGPSMLDGSTPIVAITTGLARESANPKTGDMLQTWILRQDMAQHAAAYSGFDDPICGDCPLTKLVSVSGIVLRDRRCYTLTNQAPTAVFNAWQRGVYDNADSLAAVARGRMLRLGAYGDPLAVPLRVWRQLTAEADGWTGYTHSWRIRRFWRFRRLVMASCESATDHKLAMSRGWRTFTTGLQPGVGQITCPNTSHGITCESCGL